MDDYSAGYANTVNIPGKKWYRPSVEYGFTLQVPAAKVRERLQAAFAFPVTFSKGFFSAKIKYTGSINGNEMDASFTFLNTRGNPEYHVLATIIEDSQGSRIEMTVLDETTILQLILPILLIVGFISYTESVMTAIPVLLFYFLFWMFGGRLACKNAASSIADTLNRLVSDNVPAMNGKQNASGHGTYYQKDAKIFQHPFSFKGRVCRKEYYAIGFIIGAIALPLLDIFIHLLYLNRPISSGFILIISILFAWVSFAHAVKRCHDCGKSGWWLLIPVYALILLVEEGDPGSNKYGFNPKEVGI